MYKGGRGRGRISEQQLRRPNDEVRSFPNPVINEETHESSQKMDRNEVFFYNNPNYHKQTENIGIQKPTMAVGAVLSPVANEFVPSFSQTAQKGFSIDSHEGPTGNLIIEDNNQASLSMNSEQQMFMFSPTLKYSNHPVILEVNQAVVDLSFKPQKFNRMSCHLTSILSHKVKDDELMKECISVIYEQGIGEANFKNTGARLFQHLSQNVSSCVPNRLSFRNILMKKCQEEFTCAPYYACHDLQRLSGLTLFLAEILVNVLSSAGNPFDKIRDAVLDLVELLLEKRNGDILKHIAHIVKCCGRILATGDKDKFQMIIYKIKDCSVSNTTPENVRRMLIDVLELRAADWGRSASYNSSTIENKKLTLNEVNYIAEAGKLGRVYFGTDGRVRKTVQESDDSSSEDEPVFTPEDDLDEEIEREYEIFLQN